MNRREADDALIAAGRFYVDFMDTVMDQVGEIMLPIKSGAIQRSRVLDDLVATKGYSRIHDHEITILKNGGEAHLDLMVADYVVSASKAMNADVRNEAWAEPVDATLA